MLLTLRLKNFYSLRDDSVIDFTADLNSYRNAEFLSENLLSFDGDKFVNVVGLFGSNAAGKSNMIKGIDFCRKLILTSHLNNEGDRINLQPFKFHDDNPSEFYMDFVVDGIEYEYSFSLKRNQIEEEHLYYYPKKRKARIFSRFANGEYKYGKGLIQRPSEIEGSVGATTLFLSRASSMNRELPRHVYKYFLNNMLTELPKFDPKAIEREDFEKYKTILMRALEVSDSDIIDIVWKEPYPGQIQLQSFHRENPHIPFDFETEESEGSKRLLYICLMLLKKMKDGCVIFWDEFDLKLHLRLAEFIIDFIRESKNMQLVYTSHNPMLIDSTKFRPEQIIIVNKDETGNSEFIPLSDYDELGKKVNFRSSYLQGRFDGVPYIGMVKTFMENIRKEI